MVSSTSFTYEQATPGDKPTTFRASIEKTRDTFFVSTQHFLTSAQHLARLYAANREPLVHR